ncbi:MAG: hypothetical protein LT103_11290 [Burkholderiaceae bacterium]|nr:hypothetical protein [Burkholderiaceae bacterium]ODS94861.1 MAG: hypothetical protein ABS56_17155 [Lautropia sp. SCN 69-89]
MGLFRRDGPVVFERHAYGRRRARSVPRWLLWLLAGIAVGAGGLFYVQEEYLPPRLTPAESQRLQARVGELDAERQRLQAALDKASAEAKAAQGGGERLAAELADARQSVERLRADLALFDEVLPPDPRGGAVAVRAAKFANEDGRLAYHVLLTRERKGGKPFAGVMGLAVAGERAGRNETIDLGPVEVSLAGYQHLRGTLPLPAGFAARQVTIRVLDRPGGTLQGMRVINAR